MYIERTEATLPTSDVPSSPFHRELLTETTAHGYNQPHSGDEPRFITLTSIFGSWGEALPPHGAEQSSRPIAPPNDYDVADLPDVEAIELPPGPPHGRENRRSLQLCARDVPCWVDLDDTPTVPN